MISVWSSIEGDGEDVARPLQKASGLQANNNRQLLKLSECSCGQIVTHATTAFLL